MKQREHLAKMANQIALNMDAWGDEEQVAEQVANHLSRFWSRDMLAELAADQSGLSTAVVLALQQLHDEAPRQ